MEASDVRLIYTWRSWSFSDLFVMGMLRHETLGHGLLYIKIQNKITESMFASYNRWVFEHKKPDSVETLRKWIIQESEFQTVAPETLSGESERCREGKQTFFGQTKVPGRFNDMNCDVCKNKHPPSVMGLREWMCLAQRRTSMVTRLPN